VRGDKRLTNRLAIAKLRFPDACIENIDFAAQRGLDRRQLLALAQGEWLKAHEHLILTGQTGTGKTWLACAIGRQAARPKGNPNARQNPKTRFSNLSTVPCWADRFDPALLLDRARKFASNDRII